MKVLPKNQHSNSLAVKAIVEFILLILIPLLVFYRCEIMTCFGVKYDVDSSNDVYVFSVLTVMDFVVFCQLCSDLSALLGKWFKQKKKKRFSKTSTDPLSFKVPIVELSLVVFILLFIICKNHYKSEILTLLNVTYKDVQHYDEIFVMVSLVAVFYVLYEFMIDLLYILEKRGSKKMKGKMRNKKAKPKGKLYSLDEVAKILRESDIVEFEIMTPTDIVSVGASSDCKPGGFEFFDKAYYIGDKEYELEQESRLLDELRHICAGESIYVLSIDGVKQK